MPEPYGARDGCRRFAFTVRQAEMQKSMLGINDSRKPAGNKDALRGIGPLAACHDLSQSTLEIVEQKSPFLAAMVAIESNLLMVCM